MCIVCVCERDRGANGRLRLQNRLENGYVTCPGRRCARRIQCCRCRMWWWWWWCFLIHGLKDRRVNLLETFFHETSGGTLIAAAAAVVVRMVAACDRIEIDDRGGRGGARVRVLD